VVSAATAKRTKVADALLSPHSFLRAPGALCATRIARSLTNAQQADHLTIRKFKKDNMAKYRIIYWKHIPQSFIVEGDGRTIKRQLSQKIQDKIDAYAMVEGLTSTSEYAAQYKRGEWRERDGSAEAVAEALLAELEAEAAKIEIPRRNSKTKNE
jgi:hypothetical protein